LEEKRKTLDDLYQKRLYQELPGDYSHSISNKQIISQITPQQQIKEIRLLDKTDKSATLSPALETQENKTIQTIIIKRGLATTPNGARQLITHGQISIDQKKVNIPSYIVSINEESKIKLLLTKKPKPVKSQH